MKCNASLQLQTTPTEAEDAFEDGSRGDDEDAGQSKSKDCVWQKILHLKTIEQFKAMAPDFYRKPIPDMGTNLEMVCSETNRRQTASGVHVPVARASYADRMGHYLSALQVKGITHIHFVGDSVMVIIIGSIGLVNFHIFSRDIMCIN
jgi:hypothetical protein